MGQFEVKLFKQSSWFAHLQEAIYLYDKMDKRADNPDKFDIESENGQKAWSIFLKAVKNLCTSLGIQRSERNYIDKFSNAYKILYKEDNTVYLPEIFDSAQEGYSHLWVNGEKYVFSEDVLNSGETLKKNFHGLKKNLENFETIFKYKIKNNEDFREVKKNLNLFLVIFYFISKIFLEIFNLQAYR